VHIRSIQVLATVQVQVLRLLIKLQPSIFPPSGLKSTLNRDEYIPRTIQKPWTEKKCPKKKWHTIFPLLGVGLGVALVALECWQGLSTVVNHKYCPVYEEFSSGSLDPKIWAKEAETGGFG
jgi:hypothetical protein